ncbi:zinc ABC transporter substrate-binding protein [Azospirillum rugosum]|uniref:High-affinity zinc uptake system protein ZnuA n=1 Tax=Azospirillum rugosum TaxID=416170 RepID=A0ABS4SMR8_9PROT|nr:zinc ABC transporter substrate-binding protein [Azospirillum rugosum]MBP2293844.1 zinc transport system substrate-binding protein [Azospirillum rugosum]MDQ0526969.1 zinc transport system substrate-binding protein [Azospirillum rugosum]
MRPALPAVTALITAALLTASPALADAPAKTPKVVASIKPVHALVAAVMQGVGEPTLIVRGAASPHTYALKPSDARALADADLVFWIGPELEGFLAKPLEATATKATAVELMEAPGVALLDAREGGAWDPHDHGHDHAHEGGHEEVNTHVWLDPDNARAMVGAIADALEAKDAAHADAYRANAERTARGLAALDAELKAALAPVQGKPFVVFHDAYQYFEAHYGLNGVGAITVNPERRPSAKRLSDIRAKITSLGAVCVFAEPQFEPALVDTIVQGTKAKKGVLDPEGANLPDGPDLYPTLLRNIAASLKGCLGT